MSLDSQFRPEDEFYARVYKAPIEELAEEKYYTGPGALARAGAVSLAGGGNLLIGGGLTCALVRGVVDNQAEVVELATLGVLASIHVGSGLYMLRAAFGVVGGVIHNYMNERRGIHHG